MPGEKNLCPDVGRVIEGSGPASDDRFHAHDPLAADADAGLDREGFVERRTRGIAA